jgi:hypothetical protein
VGCSRANTEILLLLPLMIVMFDLCTLRNQLFKISTFFRMILYLQKVAKKRKKKRSSSLLTYHRQSHGGVKYSIFLFTPTQPKFLYTELNGRERWEKVFWIVAKTFSLLLLLYIFICSLDLLSSSLQLLGGRAAGKF